VVFFIGNNEFIGRFLMFRDLIPSLEKWLDDPARKSLILRGARQVGKTWLVRDLAKRRNLDLVEINFEKNAHAKSIFEKSLDPNDIKSAIELEFDRVINWDRALIFFDEIQDCAKAITSLKHFSDSNSRVPVIGAGSYLGMIEGQAESVSQPIGYVDELTLFPLSFSEFLRASDPHTILWDGFLQPEKIPGHIHEKILQHYRDYLYVGGLPEVCSAWFALKSEGKNIKERTNHVRNLQLNLLSLYKSDFAKYQASDAFNIARTWGIIAEQLSKNFLCVKRFSFKGQIPSKRDYKSFENYFLRLEACGLIYRSHVLHHPTYPLMANKKESLFKSFYFDVGLLLAQMNFEYSALNPSQDIIYTGLSPIA
jgi:predicted AAA+ superfamily ATPase